ncbi:MAG: MFS transporter [Clostridia bacterium]|nr:MFS transporter [Clostridia bacterium]
MGFSLEPHQAAYQQALEAEFTQPLSDLTDENAITLRDQAAKYFTEKDAQGKLDAYLAEHVDQKDSPEAGRVLEAFARFIGNQADTINSFRRAISFSTVLFWAMAFMVGTVQGGIQAVSRSYFGKLIPKDRSNEFFGFFDIFGKFASVLGPFLYSVIGTWTGRSSYGVLALICLFLVGLTIMIGGKKEFEALDVK